VLAELHSIGSQDMIQRLNIAMISIHSCPIAVLGGRDTGGMNVYVRELARELAIRGHAVDIYTKAHQPQHGPPIDLGRNVRIIHLDTGADEDMPKLAIYDYIQRLASVAENFRNHNMLQYDLIHSHYWLSGLIGKELQMLWQVPHTVMFHTLGAIKNSFGIGDYEPKLRVESEREVISSCHRIIASTARESEELVKLYGASPDKITVIPCGINLGLFQPVDRKMARMKLGLDHQKIILFVGRLDPLKGLEQLLTAMTYLDGEKPLLLIVGGDAHSQGQLQALKSLAEELNIEKRVQFIGSVAQSQLPLFYSAADVCAIPSYYESFGMVALESLACGTPVVATNVGGMKNIIINDEMGRIVSDNSPHHLAGEISELIRPHRDEERHIKTRRGAVAEFRWATIADRILHEYHGLLGD
jgi:D-inositol-3-phosphate glycosyltransferase